MRERIGKIGKEFKDRAVARLLPPESASLEDVACEGWRGSGDAGGVPLFSVHKMTVGRP
jgi:hypothetical protein